ncbi:MAG: hypothetical protein Q8K54_08170, partial [Gallionella sp.]|nr:hypothetical protein [Gallionella sp.]
QHQLEAIRAGLHVLLRKMFSYPLFLKFYIETSKGANSSASNLPLSNSIWLTSRVSFVFLPAHGK